MASDRGASPEVPPPPSEDDRSALERARNLVEWQHELSATPTERAVVALLLSIAESLDTIARSRKPE